MERSPSSSRNWVGALLVLALLLSGCTRGGPASPSGPTGITVGSFNFPESVVLAELYAQDLRAHGYPVRLIGDVGPREVVGPALARGLLDLVPEYGGSALTFFTLGAARPSHDPQATNAALARALTHRGLVALGPAPAQDANAIVVTAAIAARYQLRSISDLAPVAPELVFGGPPECPQRPLCLVGLRAVYDLRFRAFVGTDTDGPLTLAALLGGDIDVAKMDTTSPMIAAHHLVVLADDRGLQPAENVTPVIRRAILLRYGTGVSRSLDTLSAALTSADLTALTAQAMRDPSGAVAIARRWLADHGLVRAG